MTKVKLTIVKMTNVIRIPLWTSLVLLSLLGPASLARPAGAAASTDTCRFGITAPMSAAGYDLASIGVGSFLDWSASGTQPLPAGMDYLRVLRLSDAAYPGTLASLAGWIAAHPGAVWIVGNEPDRKTYQDSLTPEVYAERYFALASIIRSHDPTARIGFGSIVQPTPIRRRYLQRAWNTLIGLAGSPAVASSLIDIWSIHAFILDEAPGSWGAGIPVGFENDYADVETASIEDTHSIIEFTERIRDFRVWMNSLGERSKPVWVTEYGSLFPSTLYRPDLGVTEQETVAFMVGTFDFLLSAADPATGLPSDGDRLVQRWFWYSLNEHRYTFGGSLFDPDNGGAITPTGQTFRDYQATSLAAIDLAPTGVHLVPLGKSQTGGRVDYRVEVQIINAPNADTGAAVEVWLYDGDPGEDGVLIAGPVAGGAIQRCGGRITVPVLWPDVEPGVPRSLAVYVQGAAVDANPVDNQASFQVVPLQPRFIYVPMVSR